MSCHAATQWKLHTSVATASGLLFPGTSDSCENQGLSGFKGLTLLLDELAQLREVVLLDGGLLGRLFAAAAPAVAASAATCGLAPAPAAGAAAAAAAAGPRVRQHLRRGARLLDFSSREKSACCQMDAATGRAAPSYWRHETTNGTQSLYQLGDSMPVLLVCWCCSK
jgi:hypothetical protein